MANINTPAPKRKTTITTPSLDKYLWQEKQMKIERGLIGWLFGTEKNAPFNIAGIIVIILIAAGIISVFHATTIPSAEFWNTIGPIITLILGYIFGKKSS
jgi:uncharacterized membrane protein HdeD (DUF308 family)